MKVTFRRHFFQCACLLLFMSTFCSAIVAQEAREPKPKSLFPLEIGTEWTYASYIEKEVKDEKLKSKVVGKHLFGDQLWYCIDEFDYAIWVRNTSEGEEEAEVSIDEETQLLKVDRSFLFFKYPAMPGETWRTYEMEDGTWQRMQLKEVDVKLEVPAGKFECLLYELVEGGKVIIRFHIAPGIGIVKFETTPAYSESGKSEHEELTSYRIGNKKVEPKR